MKHPAIICLNILTSLLLMGCSGNTANRPDVSAPRPKEIPFPTNTEIEYGIGRALDTTVAPFRSGDFKVTILSDGETEMPEAFDNALLLQKLKDTSTNWAANLLLYAKHDRDAFTLRNCDITTWRRVYKADDVRYWNEKLNPK